MTCIDEKYHTDIQAQLKSIGLSDVKLPKKRSYFHKRQMDGQTKMCNVKFEKVKRCFNTQ